MHTSSVAVKPTNPVLEDHVLVWGLCGQSCSLSIRELICLEMFGFGGALGGALIAGAHSHYGGSWCVPRALPMATPKVYMSMKGSFS